MIFNDLWDLCHLDPSCELVSVQPDVECHELVVWRVIDSKLNPFLALGLDIMPMSTEILAIDLNTDYIWVLLLHVILDLIQRVVESVDQNRCIEEVFLEEGGDVIDRNWDLV